MKGLLVALAVTVGVSGTASAAVDPAARTLGHVKRLERHNKFHLRQRMGGAFKLSRTYCGVGEKPNVCQWDATTVKTVDGASGYGMRVRCTVQVRLRVTRTGAVRSWRRHVVACGQQLWGAP